MKKNEQDLSKKSQQLMGMWFQEIEDINTKQTIVIGKSVKEIISKIKCKTKNSGVIHIYRVDDIYEIVDFKTMITVLNDVNLQPTLKKHQFSLKNRTK